MRAMRKARCSCRRLVEPVAPNFRRRSIGLRLAEGESERSQEAHMVGHLSAKSSDAIITAVIGRTALTSDSPLSLPHAAPRADSGGITRRIATTSRWHYRRQRRCRSWEASSDDGRRRQRTPVVNCKHSYVTVALRRVWANNTRCTGNPPFSVGLCDMPREVN